MTVEQLIYDRLLANATIAALVGTRVFPDYNKVPPDPNQIALSEISFWLEKEDEVEDVTRVLSWYQAIYAFQCMAETPDQKVSLANAVKAELKSLKGTTGDLIIKDSKLSDNTDRISEDQWVKGMNQRVVYQEIWWRNT